MDKLLKEMAHIVARITSTVKYVEKNVDIRLRIIIIYRYIYNIILSIKEVCDYKQDIA